MTAKRNLLLSVDESPESERACDWLCNNLLREGDEVHLFHVIAPPHAEVMGGGASGADELLVEPPDLAADQEMVEEANQMIIEKFASRLGSNAYKVEVVRFETSANKVAEALCQRAGDLQAAALVMASHNRNALQRWFLGSASAYVAANCPAPLIILH
mmetsp:Transcript_16204/g.48542  ORF Transcript_16204/g.48542 Transcript_16204/m.48542 type:complete len:158 (+) Transcript_16204:396-869(+)